MTRALGGTRGRFLPSLFLGDLVVVIIFTLLGMIEHGTARGALSVLITAVPFLIAWVAIGLWLGVFWERAVTGVGPAVRSAALAWLLTIPIAMQLRVLLLQQRRAAAFCRGRLSAGRGLPDRVARGLHLAAPPLRTSRRRLLPRMSRHGKQGSPRRSLARPHAPSAGRPDRSCLARERRGPRRRGSWTSLPGSMTRAAPLRRAAPARLEAGRLLTCQSSP